MPNILLTPDGVAGDQFGFSVSISDPTIVVSACNDDDMGSDTGSIYTFDLSGQLVSKLVASDSAAGDNFGSCVLIFGSVTWFIF